MKRDKRILQSLVAAGREAARRGFVIGEDGNISLKRGGILYIKRRHVSMGNAGPSGYVRVDLATGMPLQKADTPTSELHMHLACYRARKDIAAVIHTHPVFATAMSISGAGIKPISYEMSANIKTPVARIGYIKAGTPELGRAVGLVVKRHNAVLLKNHGLVTVGRTLDEAFIRTLAVERAVLTYIACKVLGRPGFMRKEEYLRLFRI